MLCYLIQRQNNIFTVFIVFENKQILLTETYFATTVLYYVEFSSSDAS